MRVNLMSCVILAILMLAGCGSDNSAENNQNSEETTTLVTESMLVQDSSLHIDESHHVMLTIEPEQSTVDATDLSGAGTDCYDFEVTQNISTTLHITSPNGKFTNALYEEGISDALVEASEGIESVTVTLVPNKTYKHCIKNNSNETQSLTSFFELVSSSSTSSISSSLTSNDTQDQHRLTATNKIDCSKQKLNYAGLNLTGHNFANSEINHCSFKNATLDDASFMNTSLENNDFTDASFVGTDFTKCNWSDGNVFKNNYFSGAKGYYDNYYCVVDSPIDQCQETIFTIQNLEDLIAQKQCPSDYPSCDFSAAYMKGKDLSGANLTGVNFTGATINQCQLISTNLSNASLKNASITNSDASGANMYGADLTKTNFSNTWLSGVIYNDSGNTIYCEAGSKGSCTSAPYSADDVLYLLAEKRCPPNNPTCHFPKLYISDKDLSGIDLSNANLEGTYFENVNFTKANLNGVQGVVDWGNSIFKGAIFTQNEYCMASSTPGNCADATYAPSDVQELINNQSAKSGSDFTGVYLSGEQFWQGVFDNVVFNEANFSNATIKDTSMRDSQFQNAIFHGASIALGDFSYSQFVDANFSDAIFDDQTSFKNAVFNNVNFQNTDFRSVLLDDATFSETDFTYSTVNIEEILNNSQISGKTTMPNGTVCEDLVECIKLCTSANNYCEWHP